jgi:glycerophosphoryl diester phosphodiesterase
MPRWIAHRGGGHWAPENTLAAFRVGLSLGFRGFECDVQLSRDEVAVLIHDATLERTSGGAGTVRSHTADDLAHIDAGSWHSPAFAGEPIPRLDDLLSWAREHDVALNLELKPAPGDDEAVAHAVMNALARIQSENKARKPLSLLISSFSASALAAMGQLAEQAGSADLASQSQSGSDPGREISWPRAWLVETWADSHPNQAVSLGCQGLSAHWSAWTAERVASCHARGLACAAYTVNEAGLAQSLFAMGVNSLFTDTLLPEG